MSQMIFAVAEKGERIMAEYIERETLLERAEYDNNYRLIIPAEAIKAAPAADVAPAVHGRWEYNAQTIHTQSMMRCSICGWWTLDPSVDGAYHYCPNCGAKMDLEEEHG